MARNDRLDRERLFDFQAPRAPPKNRSHFLPDPPSEPSYPIGLYDRHIPHHLILKRVEIRPSLASDICAALDAYSDPIGALPDTTFGFPTDEDESWSPSDARSLEDVRSDTLSAATCQVASSLLINPTQPYDDSLLIWSKCDLRDETLVSEQFCSMHCHLQVFTPGEYSRHIPNDDTKARLAKLLEYTPWLITGMHFSDEAETLLRTMGDVASRDKFPWQTDSICSQVAPSIPPPPDAPEAFWGAATHSRKLLPRRSTRLRERVEGIARRIPNPGDVSSVDWFPAFDEPYDPLPADYIQKAWSTAVRLDTSLILFDCGGLIRIGVRQRATQTLLLSDVIDIVDSTEPTYGQLWTALHVAAVHDAFQRVPLLFQAQTADRVHRKRKAEHIAMESRKRAKLPESKADARVLTTKEYIATHTVAALTLQFGLLDSPAPTVLSTADVAIANAKDYLNIVLDGRLGAGSTGDAFNAILEPDGSSRSPKYTPFVVKMATTTYKIRRLKHEYGIYMRLHKAGVKGIPMVMGFFESSSTNMSIMILSHVGQPLGLKMNEEKSVELPRTQILQLRRTLRAIHKAGVLHRDIRSWNMMEDVYGRVYIADFDRATINGSKENYNDEKKRLNDFLAGKYVDEARVIGLDDIDS